MEENLEENPVQRMSREEAEAALEEEMSKTCTVCHGKRSEHKSTTKHMFTEEEGVLMTPAQAKQAQMRAESPRAQVIQLPGMTPGHSTMTDRLIQVLLQKQLISKDEALFILGVGPEPQRFRDPAAMMAPRKAASRIGNFHKVGGEPTDGDDSGTDGSE